MPASAPPRRSWSSAAAPAPTAPSRRPSPRSPGKARARASWFRPHATRRGVCDADAGRRWCRSRGAREWVVAGQRYLDKSAGCSVHSWPVRGLGGSADTLGDGSAPVALWRRAAAPPRPHRGARCGQVTAGPERSPASVSRTIGATRVPSSSMPRSRSAWASRGFVICSEIRSTPPSCSEIRTDLGRDGVGVAHEEGAVRAAGGVELGTRRAGRSRAPGETLREHLVPARVDGVRGRLRALGDEPEHVQPDLQRLRRVPGLRARPAGRGR